jgi:Holliday junction resolvase
MGLRTSLTWAVSFMLGQRLESVPQDPTQATEMRKKRSLPEPSDVLYRIKRGLAGYVSYLAACEMNEAFSEYILYEPIVRIMSARGYTVRSEVPCPGVKQPKTDDKKKIDFVACRNKNLTCAMEVKWARRGKIKIDSDLEKLSCCRNAKPGWKTFLCVFGRKSHITKLLLPKNLQERGDPVIAEFGKTRFGCRVYELIKPITN